ncbi:MAG: TonB-dependent receptor [Gemmatimonadaceae bacterium]
MSQYTCRSVAGDAFERVRLGLTSVCICLIVVPQHASAQSRDSTRKDSTARNPAALQAVTVTASPADHRAPSTSTHVTQQQIELAPAATPWDLLRQTAGVEVHQQGQGPGFASDASIRGFSSDHSTDMALWVDGVPINEPVNGHAEGYNDWSLLFPLAIQDIDVIKGPVSPLYGNFAVAGVVNVRTLERMQGTQAVATVGSFGRVDGTVLSGFDHGADGGVFGLRASREDGFRPNSEDDLTQGHARLVHDITPNVTLDAGVELYAASWNSAGYLSEREFADRQYDIISNSTDGGDKQHAQERVSLRVIHNSLLWRSTAYATQGNWQLFLTIPRAGGQFEGSGSQTEEIDTRTGYGLTSAVSTSLGATTLTLGTVGQLDNAKYQNYFTTNRSRDSVDVRARGQQLSGALFLASTTSLGPLRLDIGGRYDLLGTRSTPDTVGGESVGRAHAVLSPKFGALLRIAPHVSLYANTSKGFRSADGVLTDPALVPITVWAYESGLKLDAATFTASAAVFRMNVSNEQTFNPLTAGSFNGGASRHQGVELELHGAIDQFVTLSSDWTFNDARYTKQVAAGNDPFSLPVILDGLRVYNTARYVGSTTLDISPNRSAESPWTVQLSGNWVGPYAPFDEPGVALGAYGLVHASAHFRLNNTVGLDVGTRNMLDRAYPELVADHLVSPGEPRSVYVGVKYVVR